MFQNKESTFIKLKLTHMRTIIFSAIITASLIGCNQKPASSEAPIAVPDRLTENLKGNVTQVETDSYNIDSTGKVGPLDEKDIEKYDSSGYTISYVSMNGKDSVKSVSKYWHNAQGFMTSMETKDAGGEKKSAMKIEYDSTGNYKTALSYDSTGKLDVYYTDIKSNKFGEVTGAKGYHKDSILKMGFTNDYDSIYYVSGETKDSIGKVTYSNKVKLNDKNDATEFDETTVTTDPKTKKDSTTNTVTTYKYDAWDNNGNWTQQTSYNEKGKPIKVVKRIITYKQ